MANKRISELSSRTPSATDLMLVGDPTTGYSYKCLVSQVGGVTSVFGRTGAVTAQEGDYSLTSLSDVTITGPASGDILTYNGSSWVNSAGGFVPYTGATQNVSLGEYGILAGWYRLDTTPTGTPTNQGTIYWDNSFNTAAIIMNGTTQEIGHDQFYQAKNSTGSTIPKGTAVRFAGTDGGSGHLLIAPFLADGSNPSSYFMGVTAEAITNGSFGKVQSFGRLDGIDTSAFAEGDLLYCSTTVAGGFQTTVPQAPNNIILVAAVVSDAVNGKILIRPTLGSKLSLDESVRISSPTNGQVLQYNSTLAVWQNVNASSLSVNNIYTADGSLTGNRTVTMGGRTLTFLENANLNARILVKNDATSGTSAEASLTAQSNSGVSTIGRFSLTATAYKIISAGDAYVYSSDKQLAILADNSVGQIKFAGGGSSTAHMTLFNTGNLGINTTTDAGFRLDVNGTMRVQGNTTLSNGATLQINNTGNTVGSTILYASTPYRGESLLFQWGGGNVFGYNASGWAMQNISTNNDIFFINRSVLSQGASGGSGLELVDGGRFSPTTGTNTYNAFSIRTRYNSTGGTNTIRGIFYNPTIESLTGATHIAIQTVTGDVLLGTTSGNTVIGSSSAFGGGFTGLASIRKDMDITAGGTFRNSQLAVGSSTTNGAVTIGYSTTGIGAIQSSVMGVSFSPLSIQGFGGNLLVGTTTDAGFRLDVNGTFRAQSFTTINAAPAINGDASLVINGTTNNSTGGQLYNIRSISTVATNTGNMNGIDSAINNSTTAVSMTGFNAAVNISANTTTTAKGYNVGGAVTGTGIVTSYIGYDFLDIFKSGSGAITRQFGIRIANLTAGTNANVGLLFNNAANTGVSGTWDIYAQSGNNSYFAGNIGIGTTSPTYKLHTVGTGRITGNVELSVDSGAYTIIGATGDTTYRLSVDGDLRVYGSVRTANPSGGTSTKWRLGSYAAATVQLDTGGYLEVEVNGTAYKVGLVMLP